MLKERWLLFAGVAGILAVAVACAPAPAPAPAPAGDSGAPAADKAMPDKAMAGPKPGGSLTLRLTIDPVDFDMTYVAQSTREYIMLAYDSLLAVELGPDVGYNQRTLVPNLAESWEASPDAKTFTFQMRKGVKFADLPPVNGREFTAEDVKFSIEYMARGKEFEGKKSSKSRRAWQFSGLKSVETPDASTVVVTFKEPYVPFLQYMATHLLPMMPREIYDRDGHFRDTMVGTGPVQLDTAASQKGSRWVYKRNANYWGEGKPYIDEVRVLVLSDDATTFAAFQTKQLDIVHSGIEAEEAKNLRKNVPEAQFLEFEGSPRHVYINVIKPPLDNPLLRKAIGLAIDRDEWIRVFSGGQGGWAAPGAFAGDLTQEDIRSIMRYDPEEAKRLVVEAGYPNGVDVVFEYPTDRGQSRVTEMELFQDQLKKVGINLKPSAMAYAEYSKLKKKLNSTFNISGKYPYGDIDGYLYQVFYPGSKGNYGNVDDPKLNPLLKASREELDPAKRKAIAIEAITYIVDNGLGTAIEIPLAYEFWQPYVKNYFPNVERSIPVELLWIDK